MTDRDDTGHTYILGLATGAKRAIARRDFGVRQPTDGMLIRAAMVVQLLPGVREWAEEVDLAVKVAAVFNPGTEWSAEAEALMAVAL